MPFDVEKIHRPDRLYRNIRCDGCGIDLPQEGPPAFTEGTDEQGPAWTYLQPADTLILRLSGGYGMAIDPCGDGEESDFTQLFCRACTRKLCEQWPSIARVVMTYGSSGMECTRHAVAEEDT